MILLLAALLQEPITAGEFTRLHTDLRKRDKWETIAWRTELLEARATAVKEGKPLFIWTMDGQTLGCV